MSRKTNIINNVLMLALTVACVFIVTLVGNNNYYEEMGTIVLYFVLGAVAWAFINTTVHELCHYFSGKKNGFTFVSMRIFFLEFTKENGKLKCRLTGFLDESGSTEMIPENAENIEKRFYKMTLAGSIANIVLMVIGIVPIFLVKILPCFWYCFISVTLPVSAYYVFGNLLPMVNEGVRNDGAVLRGLKKNDDYTKVLLNLLLIHAEIYKGKTPSEVNEELYFNLPQLSEEDNLFVVLLNARYTYYVDKGDYQNAIKLSDRLESIFDSMPRYFKNQIAVDLLYNACTFNLDEDKADDYVEDYERFLNNVNSITNVRVKLAYVTNVLKDYILANKLKEKAFREIAKCKIKGLALYEEKLVKALTDNLPENSLEDDRVEEVDENN